MKPYSSSCTVLSMTLLATFALSESAAAEVVVDAAKFLDCSRADCGFQQAIDQVAERDGGIVRLPAGEFALRRGLILKDGVELVGAGMDKTVLVPARQVRRLDVDADGPQDDRVVLQSVPEDLVVGSAVVSCRWLPPPYAGSPRPAVVTAIDRATKTVTLRAPYGLNRMDLGKGFLTFGVASALAADVKAGDTELQLADARLVEPGDELTLGEPGNDSLR